MSNKNGPALLTVAAIENHPRYRPHDEIEDMTGRDSAQRNVISGRTGKTHGQPPQQFILMLDLKGNLVQFPISSNEVERGNKRKKDRGPDNGSWQASIVQRKVQHHDMVVVDLDHVPGYYLTNDEGRRRAATLEENRKHWEKVVKIANERREAAFKAELEETEARKPQIIKALESAADANAQTREALAMAGDGKRRKATGGE